MSRLSSLMDIRYYNREAWNKQVEKGNPWTRPVSPETIAAARRGEWRVLLTEQKPVPREWFRTQSKSPSQTAGDELRDLDILCLASGGGQQAPIFAAAGARVTVLDNSPKQLEQDRLVAEREGLAIKTVEGDMRDLSILHPQSFDLVFHPVSNLFVDDVRPVWREAFRVLRGGGVLLAGFMNPAFYIFDMAAQDGEGELVARHKLPYTDINDLAEEERARVMADGLPLEFSHTLEDQIGGQLEAGLVLVGLYEDYHAEARLAQFMPTYLATRALKPSSNL